MQIFFDLDGTLIDTSVRNYRVYAQASKEFSGKPIGREEYWMLKRLKTPWETLLPRTGLPVEIEKEFLSFFIGHIEQIDYLKLDSLMDSAKPTLQSLSDHKLYLVSLRRNPDNLSKQLDWLGISDFFSDILSGHSESDGFDIKEHLIGPHLTSKDGIVVGDTEADIIAAQALGLKSVAVSSGIREESFLKDLRPDHLLSNVADIHSVLT